MSLVADGPLIHVCGRVGSRRAMASGTEPTTWSTCDDAHVQVGQQAERATTLVGAGIEHDRARLRDRHGAAGDDPIEPIEVGMRQERVVGRPAPRSIPRATLSGMPAGTAILVARVRGQHGRDGRRQVDGRRRGGRSPGSRSTRSTNSSMRSVPAGSARS